LRGVILPCCGSKFDAKEDEEIYKLRHDLKKTSITQQPQKHRTDEVNTSEVQFKSNNSWVE